VKALLFGVVALLAALPAAAQVGHEPAKSPYIDLEHNQEITAMFGYTRMRHDPAGIAPQSAPAVGVRYELTLTGPLALSADLVTAFANREVIDPALPKSTRDRGPQSAAVHALDLALAMNLTGQKSWHNFVPQVRGGVGLVSSAAKDDSSGFSFGTPFAFTLGAGVKFVPAHGRIQVRADVTDRIFKLGYPDSYYKKASDLTAVLDPSTPKSFYTHHTALTVGVSYLFGR
jgi:opacity protein-like surface antigen